MMNKYFMLCVVTVMGLVIGAHTLGQAPEQPQKPRLISKEIMFYRGWECQQTEDGKQKCGFVSRPYPVAQITTQNNDAGLRSGKQCFFGATPAQDGTPEYWVICEGDTAFRVEGNPAAVCDKGAFVGIAEGLPEEMRFPYYNQVDKKTEMLENVYLCKLPSV